MMRDRDAFEKTNKNKNKERKKPNSEMLVHKLISHAVILSLFYQTIPLSRVNVSQRATHNGTMVLTDKRSKTLEKVI